MISQTAIISGLHSQTPDSIWPRHHEIKRDGERNANKTLMPKRELGEAGLTVKALQLVIGDNIGS